jgi:Tfp pilus assembly protein FimV
MRKTWVLDTETKGTGANMVPLEKVQEKTDARPRRAPRPAKSAQPRRAPAAAKPVQKTATPLPPGHVRKKTTGEIGKVRSVDPKAGTAEVFWLRRGDASTVPLSAISRR